MTKRRSILSLFLIVVLTLVSTTSAFATINTSFANTKIFADIKNHSFELVEIDSYSKPFPTDWIINGDFDIENINVLSTSAYDKINYWQFSNGAYSIESEDFIEIDGTADYLFGVKFIFSNVDDSLRLSIKTFDEHGELVDTHQGQTMVAKQSYLDLWQETFLTLNKNSSVKKVKISIEIVAGSGFVGIDNVYGYKNFFSLYDGASISLERDVLKIRFTAKIDANIYQSLEENYTSVSAGLIFSPKAKVNDAGEFTIDGITDKYYLVISPATKLSNPNSYAQDGYYTFYGAFVSQGYAALQAYTNIEYTARAYVKYTQNGEEKIIYSNWSMENNCRSMRQVAIKAKEDIDVFNSYDQDQQEIISAFIEQREPNFVGLD